MHQRISTLFTDPYLRAAFERAERDIPGDFALVSSPTNPTLTDGAVERVRELELVD